MSETRPVDHEHKQMLQAEQRLVHWIKMEADSATRSRLESELRGIRSRIAEHVQTFNRPQVATDRKYMIR